MHAWFTAFRRSRRSAVTMIFALSFIPLMYLVGLSTDYTFFSLARSQMQLAAEASATHAVRAAVSTYTLEKSQGISQTQSYSDAQVAGTQAGYEWFQAQLGTLPRGTVQYNVNGSPVPYPNIVISNPNDPGGFLATVTYSGVYPPLFNGLFNRSSMWTYPGNSQAQANFSYAQVLFLVDTSESMLIGANQSDITLMGYHSICLLGGTSTTPGAVLNTANGNIGTYGDANINNNNSVLSYSTGTAPNVDTSDAITFTTGELQYSTTSPTTVTGLGAYFANDAVMNYTAPSGGTPTNSKMGSCDTGATNATPNAQPPGNEPLSPCALSCHTTATTVTDVASTTTHTYADNPPYTATIGGQTYSYPNGLSYGDSFPMDLYGEARRLRTQQINTGLYSANITDSNPAFSFRIDVVFNAVENALNTMTVDQNIPNQFSAGVYNFDQDVYKIVAAQSGDALVEASENLTTVLQDVEADDYLITPTETAIPTITTSEYPSNEGGFTDFQQAMDDLYYGKTTPTAQGTSTNLYNTAGSLYAEECTQNASAAATAGVTLSTGAPGSSGCNLPSEAGESQANPQRFLFIITDGLDDYYNSSGTRYGGEMTAAATEAAGTDSNNATTSEAGYTSTSANSYAICQQFKNLGYTIYVLYVTYYPVASTYGYYGTSNFTATAWTQDDFASLDNKTISTQEASEVYYTAANTPLSSTPLDQVGLKACASASADFFTATGTGDIENAMQQMLASALASTIRLSN